MRSGYARYDIVPNHRTDGAGSPENGGKSI